MGVNLGVIATKGYSTVPRSPEMESHKMQFVFISRTHNFCVFGWVGIPLSEGYSVFKTP